MRTPLVPRKGGEIPAIGESPSTWSQPSYRTLDSSSPRLYLSVNSD
jgi:hypothetical protein